MKSLQTLLLSPARRGLLGMIALVIAFASVAIIAGQPAYASAYGCNFKSGISGPSSYCVKIDGYSTYVNYVSGEFRGSQEVINSYITAEFFDSNWHWYQTYKSPVTKAWTAWAYKKIVIKANKKPGYMCSTLHYTLPFNKIKTMSVCHQIKK